MNGKQLLILSLLSLLLVSPTIAVTYQEGIHLIRPNSQYITTEYSVPEYLTVEDIVFVSCLEEDFPLRNSLLCLDDNSFVDIDVTPWSTGNCYLSTYSLEDFECKDLLIQAEYTKEGENYKLTKNVRVNKLSSVLDRITDSQYSDGGWRDPLSTAYGIWALSYFKEIYTYELDLALDWLKLNRNEETKCWPKSPCNVELSANVMTLLSLSNYTDARRIVNDARNWLEELQNAYTEGDTWAVSVEAVNPNTTLSLVGYQAEVLDENFTFSTSGVKNYTFEAYEERELIVLADDNVIVNISNQRDQILITYQGDNFSYDIPGPCWSINLKGESCDITTSLWAMSSPIDEDNLKLAKDWTTENLQPGDVLGYYLGNKSTVLDTSLYLYHLYDDEKGTDQLDGVIDWILYSQNNEGSWDNGTVERKVSPTAYSVLSLFEAGFNRTYEPIEDAEEWISENEDNITENNTQALSAAFFILKHNARPLIVSTPSLLTVDEPTHTIELFNPTTFHLRELTYSFSTELKEHLSVVPKDELNSYSYRRLTINRITSVTDELHGFLTISNLGDPVAEIPVIMTNTPSLNVTLTPSITIFGIQGQVSGTAVKSGHDFVCSVNWDSGEIQTPGTFRIQGAQVSIPIRFSAALTKEDLYNGDLQCNAAGRSMTQPISLFITRFTDVPITIDPTDAVINNSDDNIYYFIQNNLDQDLTVSVSLDRYSEHFNFRSTLQLDPNELYNFTLGNNLPTDINLTSNVLIHFSVFNRTEVASLLIDISQQGPQALDFTRLAITLAIVLLVVGGLAYVLWKFRDVIFAELNKLTFWKLKNQKQKEVKRIKQIKSTEKHQAIINIYNIMKFQNKDDREIAGKLLETFNKDDVREALSAIGAALPVLDEESPEKA